MDELSPDAEAGMKVRRSVLGSAYVDAALQNATDFNVAFQQLVTQFCWGSVWTRDGLPGRTRSLLNIAMLTALNRPHELAMHVRGALNNDCTPDEIAETLLQAAVYCGIPAGVDSFRVAAQIVDEARAASEQAPAGEQAQG